ncbi:MAG TPA: DUF6755 family protein [Gemmatimonadaceae bacterium]|jgi:hypothetical protein|nr:DUF6755 family protein [Gemmatimonadaceae bacterium]
MSAPLRNVPGDPQRGVPQNPSPGQTGLVLLGISMGILLMSVQLWLLTLAFNLYLSGDRRGTLIAAIVSGGVFLGGLAMLGVLRRTRRIR